MSAKQRKRFNPSVNDLSSWNQGAEAPAPAPSQAAVVDDKADEAPKVRRVRKARVRRDSFSTRVEERKLNSFYEYANDESVSVVDALDEAMTDFLKKKGRI